MSLKLYSRQFVNSQDSVVILRAEGLLFRLFGSSRDPGFRVQCLLALGKHNCYLPLPFHRDQQLHLLFSLLGSFRTELSPKQPCSLVLASGSDGGLVCPKYPSPGELPKRGVWRGVSQLCILVELTPLK